MGFEEEISQPLYRRLSPECWREILILQRQCRLDPDELVRGNRL